jgi:RND family efflux transporter MFP subunit
VAASPRVVATSETYQFVGIVEGEVLVVYLDRASDNAPVTTASLEVSLNGTSHQAEQIKKTATYEITSPMLRQPGSIEVLVTLSDGDRQDLLVGTLVIPAAAQAVTRSPESTWCTLTKRVTGDCQPSSWVVPALAVVLAGGVALALATRRRAALLLLAALALQATRADDASAHEGHDHGPDLSASSGNTPGRRPDGSIFLPKPSQRLLEVRTAVASIETRTRMVRFSGRVIANPNRSGVVQSTIQGRYEAPDGGVPQLGAQVRAGDLLGRVAPSFASIDTSDMMQTLGNLDQEIALTRSKLARQEHLLTNNIVARAAVEDSRLQLEGLEKRRRELLAARVRPEELRAPVDGVIASTRVITGQVVSQSDQLFQIIDPASLLVEALVFDQVNPDKVTEAVATAGGAAFKLTFLGRSRSLQQQYSILQFRIAPTTHALNIGTPVAVTATTGEPVTGIVLPRAALAQAANGQTVVFIQREPEIFVPRQVRSEDFDAEHALITAGLSAGEKVVVRNAPLVNQVR